MLAPYATTASEADMFPEQGRNVEEMFLFFIFFVSTDADLTDGQEVVRTCRRRACRRSSSLKNKYHSGGNKMLGKPAKAPGGPDGIPKTEFCKACGDELLENAHPRGFKHMRLNCRHHPSPPLSRGF